MEQRVGVEPAAVVGVEASVQQEPASSGWCLPGELEEEAPWLLDMVLKKIILVQTLML